jgi:hypothetical protein
MDVGVKSRFVMTGRKSGVRSVILLSRSSSKNKDGGAMKLFHPK